MAEDRQRVDRWLWHARIVRTRSAAAALAASGHVRINGQRINAASRAVRCGDVVTVALDRTVRIVKVVGFVERRGDADVGRGLYEDLSGDTVPRPPEVEPERSGARPTKRERRAFQRLRDREE